MKWFLGSGWGLLWIGLATAGNPVPGSTPAPAPQPPVRPVGYTQGMPMYPATPAGCTDTAGSLTRVLAAPLPMSPSVPPPSTCQPCPPGYEVPCGTPLFPGVGRPCGDRSCLNRFKEWLCFQPGPRVLPILTPTPYHAPIQAYFPCRPDARRTPCAPSCAPSAPAAPLLGFRLVNADGGCGRPGGDSPRPLFGGVNVFDRGRRAYSPAPYMPATPSCATCGNCGAGGTLLDRLLAFFIPGQSRCKYARWGQHTDPYATGVWSMGAGAYDPTTSGATPAFAGPMMAGYRFASPTSVGVGQPAAMGAYPVVPPVNQPFTNP